MNKIKATFFIALFLVLTSCVKDVYLDPIDLPDVLTSEVIRVDKFSENEFFSVTNTGLYLQFDENDYVEYYSSDYADWTTFDWQQAKLSYQDGILLVSNGSKYILVSRNSIKSDEFDNSSLMLRPSSIISPSGVPLHVGFGDIQVDNNNELVYVIYIEKIESNGTTKIATEMKVSAANYDAIDLVFNPQGELVITTNPIYVVSDWNGNASNFNSIEPTNGFVNYKSIMQPTVVDGVLYGYSDAPSYYQSANTMYKFDLSSQTVTEFNLRDFCSYPDAVGGAEKHLNWNESNVSMLVPSEFGYTNVNGSPMSYIYSYNLEDETCDIITIPSSSFVQSTFSINDIGCNFNSDKVYIGLSSGLYVYDKNTDETSLFINSLLSLK
jgi:hypothetical protein